MATATFEDFQKLDMRVGVIVGVEDFKEARKPAYKIEIDFGEEVGVKRSSAQATNYTKAELLGMHIIGVVNFPPKRIAGFMSEVLILGVEGQDGQLSILMPSHPARIGAIVY